jgi:hypothetical protein
MQDCEMSETQPLAFFLFVAETLETLKRFSTLNLAYFLKLQLEEFFSLGGAPPETPGTFETPETLELAQRGRWVA